MSSYRMERKEGVCRVSVNGGLTAVLVPELQEVMKREFEAGAQQITVDLAETSMLDSSGIGLLIAAGNTLSQRAGKISVINASTEILKLLRSMRLVPRLHVSGRESGAES